MSLGFHAVKFGAGCFEQGKGSHMPTEKDEIVHFEADKMAFVKQTFGDSVQIIMDGHMGNSVHRTWDVDIAAAVMKALEPYGLLFYEEPLHYTNADGYAELCKRTTIPIAGGECLTAMSEWALFADKGSFDIAQPDASFMGGMEHFMKVAALFESKGKQIATHAWGAGGALMQNVHCAFACANTLIMEIPPAYGPLHSEIVRDSFAMRDGKALPPQAPGLGIVLTEETRNRFPFVPGTGEFNNVPGKQMRA
jgi:L-alanine-DL-glutamate epimerase-like enolase superfamily enzyme